MSAWRRKAIELLPEYRQLVEVADTPMFLWTELESVFSRASEQEDISTLSKIFDYAQWCWKESRYDDTINGALIGFYENIPSRKEDWWTVPRFIQSADFNRLEQVFRYFLTDEQFTSFHDYYNEERRRHERDALKKQKNANKTLRATTTRRRV